MFERNFPIFANTSCSITIQEKAKRFLRKTTFEGNVFNFCNNLFLRIEMFVKFCPRKAFLLPLIREEIFADKGTKSCVLRMLIDSKFADGRKLGNILSFTINGKEKKKAK